MKRKGKNAWLITWEGTEAEFNGRCKVVAILPSQYGDNTIEMLIRVLYHSESNMTLGEKILSNSPGKDPFFCQQYKDINPEMNYGHFGKDYLCARKVKNLRAEVSKRDMAEETLYWTELPKFIPNPDFDNNGPMPADLSVLTKQVRREMDLSYTYSIQPALDAFKRRRELAQSQEEA
jgi:hypothetical protein